MTHLRNDLFMTSNSLSTTSNHISSNNPANPEDRYQGLIPVTLYKKIRNTVFSLYAYVNSQAWGMEGLHFIISMLRLLQIMGPSLFLGYNTFWNRISFAYKFLNIFSVFFHIVPATARDYAGNYFTLVCIVFSILFFLILLASTFYFKAHSSLHPCIPQIIFIYINSIGYLFQPAVAEMIGEGISYSITFMPRGQWDWRSPI